MSPSRLRFSSGVTLSLPVGLSTRAGHSEEDREANPDAPSRWALPPPPASLPVPL